MAASATMTLDHKSLPPSGESRRITLEALRTLLEARRNDPDPKIANAIREFEKIQQEIERIERMLPENDPIIIAERILADHGTWLPVKALAKKLDEMRTQAPASRKRGRAAAQERRSWTNEERLGRSLLLAVSHGRLLGFSKEVDGEEVKYVGLTSFKFPTGVERIKATRKAKD